MTNKKTHVSLVRGPIVFGDGAINNEATPAIAFAYLSGYLRKYGYETTIVDAIAEGLNKTWPLKQYPGYNCHGLRFEEVISRIPSNSEVIGFSGMFSGEWPVMRDLINLVREHFPDALIVAGGEHITATTKYSLEDCPALDVCVRGEGEHTFYELLESYQESDDFTNIQGIAYLDDNGHYHQNGEETPRIRKIDEIPWPDWPEGHLEKFWSKGKSFGAGVGRDMPFLFSRGCPYRCTFCSNEGMYTTRYVLRELDDVIAEIKHYIKKYNIDSIQAYDLTAITKKSWIVAFCNRLIEENLQIKWSLPSGTRSEVLDDETLSLLKKTGCNYIVYAPESGSKRTLVNIKKRLKLSRLTESVLEAKKQKLVVRVNLIIGFPKETWRDVWNTIFYGLKMVVQGVDDVPLFIFSPYPGTAIEKDLLAAKKLAFSDEYFFSLTSLNSNFISTKTAISYSPDISARKLGIVRAFFILMNYALSYLVYPNRILRTIKNLRSNTATTVFEHRLKDLFNRKTSAS